MKWHFYRTTTMRLVRPEDPAMTIEKMLRPNPKLQAEIDGMKATMKESGLPFRLAETNSCYHGGKPAVSDTLRRRCGVLILCIN